MQPLSVFGASWARRIGLLQTLSSAHLYHRQGAELATHPAGPPPCRMQSQQASPPQAPLCQSLSSAALEMCRRLTAGGLLLIRPRAEVLQLMSVSWTRQASPPQAPLCRSLSSAAREMWRRLPVGGPLLMRPGTEALQLMPVSWTRLPATAAGRAVVCPAGQCAVLGMCTELVTQPCYKQLSWLGFSRASWHACPAAGM